MLVLVLLAVVNCVVSDGGPPCPMSQKEIDEHFSVIMVVILMLFAASVLACVSAMSIRCVCNMIRSCEQSYKEL